MTHMALQSSMTPQSLLLNQMFVGSLYLHDDTQSYYSSLQLQLKLKFDVKQTTKIKVKDVLLKEMP